MMCLAWLQLRSPELFVGDQQDLQDDADAKCESHGIVLPYFDYAVLME